MDRETWVQSQVTSYQRLLKWYLIPPCLTLSNIRYLSRVTWNNPGKGVAPFPTPWCSSYWKRCLLVTLDNGHQLFIENIWMLPFPYLPIPSLGQDMTQGQFLSGVYQVWIQSFTSRLVGSSRAEEPSLSYYLPIAGRRIMGFIPFPRVLVLCEMQSVSSRIWTRVAVSISYDENHYTTGNS